MPHPPGADTPQNRHPPGVDTPRSRPPRGDTPLGADTPWEQTPPQNQVHPLGLSTPPRTKYTPLEPGTSPTPPETDSDIRSMSSWYASYWNAFLFTLLVTDLDTDSDSNSDSVLYRNREWGSESKPMQCEHVLHSTMYSLGLESESQSVLESISNNVN